jgi:hypothetical protein
LVQPEPDNSNGCKPFTQDFTGRAVILERGACYFCAKILNAMLSGAEAVLVANSRGQLPFAMSWICTGSSDYSDPILHPNGIGIPACMISRVDGSNLKAAIQDSKVVKVGFDSYRAYNEELEEKPENDITGIGVQQLLGGYNPLPAGQVSAYFGVLKRNCML